MDKSQQNFNNEIYIGPTIQSLQACDILTEHQQMMLFISNSKKNILVMNYASQTLKNYTVDDEKIICAVYHPLLQVFIITSDKRLIYITKEAQIVSKQKITQLLQTKFLILLPMSDGYEGIPNTRKDMLLYVTSQQTYLAQIQIKYERSLLKNKNLCHMNIEFTSNRQIILYQWITKYNFLHSKRIFITWNQTEVYLFQLPFQRSQKAGLLFIYDKVSKKSDNKTICCEVCQKHRFLLAGFQFGSIKVYKYDQSKKYVCQLKGHQRQCTSLMIPKNNDDLLYSSGLDNAIRIWDLVDLLQIYHIRLDIISGRLLLLNQGMIFGKAYDNRKSYIIKMNVNLLTPLLSEQKSGKLLDLKSDSQWLIALYSNNFVQCSILPEDGERATKQFNQKIQFPVKYGFLRQTHKIKQQYFALGLQKGFCVLKLNKKQVMSEQFQLKRLVYNHSLSASNIPGSQQNTFVEVIHEKLLGTFLFSYLNDWKKIPVSVNVTAVSLIYQVSLPKWDVQIKGHKNDNKEDYVILGSDRGYIYFVDIKKRSEYYARLHYHSNSITQIQRITYKNCSQQSLHFASLTTTNQLVLWSLYQEQGPKLRARVKITLNLSLIKFFNYFLVICDKSGQLNIYQMQVQQEQNGMNLLQNRQKGQQGHLKPIIVCDYQKINQQPIFVTGGEDQSIKLWKGSKKQLLLQIKIFNQIHNLIFSNKKIHFIIAHGRNYQLSMIKTKQIQQLTTIYEQLLQQQNSQQGSNQYASIKIKDLLSPINDKSQILTKKISQRYQQFNMKTGVNPSSSSLVYSYKFSSDSRQLKGQINLPQLSARNIQPNKIYSKRRRSLIKETQVSLKNQNSILPEIQRVKSGYNVHKQSRLAKMQLSRQKSYSYAGRKPI